MKKGAFLLLSYLLSFESLIAGLLRFTGVCVLFVVGQLRKLIMPSSIAYSFRAIYDMDYDRQHSYQQMMEKAGQQMAGFLFLMAVTIIYWMVN